MKIQVGDVVGDYKVIGIAGSGAMGAVYKIEHVLTKRVEAMKLLPPGVSSEPGQAERFEREIQIQAQLHHPGIAELYNAIRVGGEMALVMEFVEGESLEQLLQAGPLPIQLAVDYAGQVLQALDYAHEAGVIHRDVAPSNIITTPSGALKLTDFGLARAQKDLRLTSSGVPIGSPWYMSPEQVRGLGQIDRRTDIYAVGAVLYELLTGAKLFDTDGAFAVMRAQVEASPVPLSRRNPAVPVEVESVVCKALAKDPAVRFQTAGEFKRALEEAMAETVRRPSVIEMPASPPPVRRAASLWAALPLRTAGYFAAVPLVVLAGFGAVRALHKPVPVVQKPAPPVAVAPVIPAPAPEPPPPAPEVKAEAPIPAPEPAKPAPVPTPATTVRAAAATPAAAPPAAPRAPRTVAAKPPQSYAIQVTGAEIAPGGVVAPPPAPAHAPIASPEPPAAPNPSNEVALPAPGSAEPQAAPAAVPADAPQGEEDKNAKSGNRLGRALGKINPFKKSTPAKKQ